MLSLKKSLEDVDCDGVSLNKSTPEMRQEILDAGFDIGADASPSEIEKIYDAYVTKKLVNRFRDERPKYPTVSPREFNQRSTKVFEFKWRDGGRLAADPRLTTQIVGQLVDIFAALVSFSSKRHTRFDHRIYRAIPTWYVDAANNCRYMEGFRLLKRMLRHSMDPKMVPLVGTSGELFMFEGELGILLKNAIPASMRGVHYPAEVAITKGKILYCSCSCPCGIES